jgi:hypothetical protein
VGTVRITRTIEGSALAVGEGQGAPRPGAGAEDETLSMGIRSLIMGWGGSEGEVPFGDTRVIDASQSSVADGRETPETPLSGV